MRKVLLAGLFLTTLSLFAVGVQAYRQNWEWLNTRHLDNLSVFLLGSFGLAVVFSPLIMRRYPPEIAPIELIKAYILIFMQVFGILAGISVLLILFGVVVELFGQYPLIILPLFLLLLPLMLIVIDMFNRKVRRSPRNLLVGYGYYSFEALYLLLAQLLLIPILFFLGPMGIALILVSILDIVARIVPALEAAPIHVLCYWTGIGAPWCTPALVLLIVVYLIAAFTAVRYGDRILDIIAGGYRAGKDRLSQGLEK